MSPWVPWRGQEGQQPPQTQASQDPSCIQEDVRHIRVGTFLRQHDASGSEGDGPTEPELTRSQDTVPEMALRGLAGGVSSPL